MASGFYVATDEHLIRSNVWSEQLKELLMDDLYAMRFVRIIDNPMGTTLNIPTLGEAEVNTFTEGQAIKYNKFDTGNFTFTWDRYEYSGNAISEKFKRDSFYTDEVISSFLPRQHRALMERVETNIFSKANAGQTASNLNTINGANHRWVASGTNETLSLADFAKARYALTKANVPLTNLVAIVDPTVELTFATQPNVLNLMSNNPEWDRIVHDGMTTGFKFRFNIYGFDVYVSNYLPVVGAETINGLSTTTGAVANLFFSATGGDVNPIIGGFKQQPTVQSEFNKDLQQTEYLTICEYGFGLYRPENMVIVLSDTDQVV
jgi:hypothetical protein